MASTSHWILNVAYLKGIEFPHLEDFVQPLERLVELNFPKPTVTAIYDAGYVAYMILVT